MPTKPDPYAEFQKPAAQSDPYAEFQAPATSGPTPPVDMSKVAGAGPGGPPQPANFSQSPAATSVLQPTVGSTLGTGATSFGTRIGSNLSALAKPVLHPKETGSDIIQRGGFPLTPDAIKAASYNPSGPDAASTAGNVLGDIATAGLFHGASRIAPPALTTVGDAAQDSGATLFNKTAGMLKSDFKRGANGGRAYLDAGGGPAWSMQGLADKASALKGEVGTKIGDVRKTATAQGLKIPTADVAGTLAPPIARGIALETGPGGMNNTGPIENYSASFRPTLQAGVANGGLTPVELQELKGGIADNTNWSDPSQFNLKAIRQQQVGALSGLENDNIPGIAPLKTQFQGLGKFAARTGERASTGSMPLTSLAGKTAMSTGGALLGGLAGLETPHAPLMSLGGGLAGLAADSVPVKTTLGSGLYGGGKLLKGAGGMLGRPSLFPSAAAVAPYSLADQKNRKRN